LRSAGRTDALHRSGPDLPGVSINRDVDMIAWLDVGEVGFLHLRDDPHLIDRYQCDCSGTGQCSCLRHEVGAGLQCIDLGDDAGKRRAH
jgi:hypothetical protein